MLFHDFRKHFEKDEVRRFRTVAWPGLGGIDPDSPVSNRDRIPKGRICRAAGRVHPAGRNAPDGVEDRSIAGGVGNLAAYPSRQDQRG